MKKVKLVQAIFTQEEIATINTKNIKLEEENRKLKELLDITVQTKNEKIRNLLEEIEYYKKQLGED